LIFEVWKYSGVVNSDGARRTRAVLTIDLKNDPAIIETYRSHHRQVWPEVVTSLQRAGIRRMEIYILGRRLVMILETDGRDFQQCFASHVASHPRVAEWEALMHSMQEPPPGVRHENWWGLMEPLFQLEEHLDGHLEGVQEPAVRHT
jgi:L-rhamnose mutarotase